MKIKLGRILWLGLIRVACRGDACRIWVRELEENNLSVESSVHGRIILKQILYEYNGKLSDEFIYLSIGSSGELL
jgi:hypothetical protein